MSKKRFIELTDKNGGKFLQNVNNIHFVEERGDHRFIVESLVEKRFLKDGQDYLFYYHYHLVLETYAEIKKELEDAE